jgi:dienelactone hydrolase
MATRRRSEDGNSYDSAMIPGRHAIPRSLRANARWEKLVNGHVPAMLVHPSWEGETAAPVVLWMHGRTVTKEIDPGRYLRWMRAGIGACAVDLPGHGERLDEALQQPERTLDVVKQMMDEIDPIVEALAAFPQFDPHRMAIGGMSAGGMAVIARLCREHPFRCASVEATTGSWSHQRRRAMFRNKSEDEIAALDPIRHLDNWREVPFQALHTRADEWVTFEGQREFIDALRARYRDPSRIEFITFDETGAPYEHAGFGRYAAEAKDQQRDFFRKWLVDCDSEAAHERPAQVHTSSSED